MQPGKKSLLKSVLILLRNIKNKYKVKTLHKMTFELSERVQLRNSCRTIKLISKLSNDQVRML